VGYEKAQFECLAVSLQTHLRPSNLNNDPRYRNGSLAFVDILNADYSNRQKAVCEVYVANAPRLTSNAPPSLAIDFGTGILRIFLEVSMP
jgi:hypothetical protein